MGDVRLHEGQHRTGITRQASTISPGRSSATPAPVIAAPATQAPTAAIATVRAWSSTPLPIAPARWSR
ncbi:hypothetical protein ACFQQB_45190 [Nonomuraea rubra]|uniref:hypothetical protein n=1 Tax=Nonomuraea rubra TaxID=46180 RepID=UPI003614A343